MLCLSIHAANLINAGIMPLTFENPDDYEKLSQGDMLEIKNIFEGMDSGKYILNDITNGTSIELKSAFTERQKGMLKAGGLLEYTKKE